LSDTNKVDISIGVYHSVSGGLLFLADGLDFFTDSGLNVTMRLYGDYNSLVEGFKNREVDVATIGLYESMIMALEDIDFVGVAPLIWRQIYFMASRDEYLEELKIDLTERVKNTRKGEIISTEEVGEDFIKVRYRVNGGIKEEMFNIRDIKNLKGKIIGMDIESIAYYILTNTLISEGGMVIDEVNAISIPETQLKSEIFKGETDIGAFSEFNRIEEDAGGLVVFDSSKYKTHTVESLLFHRDFAISHRDSVIRVIEGWKKAQVFLEEHPDIAMDIMTDRGRLNFPKDKLVQALESTPVIPIMNDPQNIQNDGQSVESVLRESYFNIAGNYSVEASQVLEFITKNYSTYNKIEYQIKTEQIKTKLEEGYYFDILYLEIAGFKKPQIAGLRFEFAPRRISITDMESISENLTDEEMETIKSFYEENLFDYQIKNDVTEEDDKTIVQLLKKADFTKFIGLYEYIDKQKWIKNLEYIPADYGDINWDEIYPKTVFAPLAVKIDVFENEVLPKMNNKNRDYILRRYEKYTYHYVKVEDIKKDEDDRIIEILNGVGYQTMSELESDSFDEYKEFGLKREILASDDSGDWGFKPNY
jgi:ABC-type nitrate/sulfonate/bicarbonate transport system substrate-binding protein